MSGARNTEETTVDPIAWKRRDALALAAAALLAGPRAWAQGDALRGQLDGVYHG